MDGLDIAAFVVMGLLVAIAVGVFLWLARLPGRVARELNHPYVQAISVGGWVTLLFGGVAWPLVLIWAYAPPGGTAAEPRSQTPPAHNDDAGGQ